VAQRSPMLATLRRVSAIRPLLDQAVEVSEWLLLRLRSSGVRPPVWAEGDGGTDPSVGLAVSCRRLLALVVSHREAWVLMFSRPTICRADWAF